MKKKTEVGRHSMLDLFLILVLVVCIVGGGLRIYGLRAWQKVPPLQNLMIELQSDAIDGRAVNSIAAGESLYWQDGAVFGVVRDVQALPLSVTLFSNGEALIGEWDRNRCCRIQVTVECAGTVRDGVFLSGGKKPIGAGETLALIGDRSEIVYRVTRVYS